jgi:two-component system, OmpR family, phosphate regulon sensor histidine kinase PhoR
MNSTRRIGLLLTFVFLLPALFFSVYELSSLNRDEKMIQDIYGKQLEAILFSVNQYSDDIVNNWVSKIEAGLDSPELTDTIPPKIVDLLNLNSAVKAVFVVDTVDGQQRIQVYSYEGAKNFPITAVNRTLADSARVMNKLISYKRSGFQKIQKLPLPGTPSASCLAFITESSTQRLRITGILVNADLFIEDLIGPRLQSIARDQFILSVMMKDPELVVYTTNASQDQERSAEALTKEFWNFPDYVLGIRTTGETLQQLVRERTRTNLILLVALDVILILGVVLVFRNLKREVALAQNKADFVSNVSHEIRTPLALISMFAETLEMGRVTSEEKKKEYYTILSKESQRLTGIVNKILSFSQSEAKKKVLHHERVNIFQAVQGVLSTYDFHLKNKGFTYTLTGKEDLHVTADREALIECFINLIDNAVKYSEDNKQIVIQVASEGGYGVLSVTDSGIGISKQDQKHIFDKFYRVAKRNLARTQGTGLGLSLVSQLMDAQRGKITVASEQGHGSTFKLYFPLD